MAKLLQLFNDPPQTRCFVSIKIFLALSFVLQAIVDVTIEYHAGKEYLLRQELVLGTDQRPDEFFC